MERYDSKYLQYFSTKRLFAEIAQLESSGWSLYWVDSFCFFGNTIGLTAVLRKLVSENAAAK